ncbi:MFS transporter [Bacillus pseudomycoides]|uniref:TCR/Tet family MFS transporter n=1 Tax=Bacillus pseudomycoides TaxID=64104 RepID=A0AAJ1Z6T8_9BACI|nr:MFS transporter [Bacillus pseudomycoides]MDR4329806.1 TCR/Tet family MFS transporter [Bacillus pseudomycoides]MED1539546.1 MFS transporter [Bacillus pseudomycoides]PEJ14686.1 tetracycline resistance MFS efflux pump [Bacillus pseudomycoides]PHD05046.1 tetracycline resistance MFS efflux pump [Bacillus pseudomycoides]PHG27685.1 tetracycline resistance MFS efflux pump [Bacillus pseudomycoides]
MKRNIIPLMTVQFFIFLGFGMIIPVLPEIITNLGVPSHHLGMLLSSYSLISFLTSPFWGKISDRIGRRPVLLIGILGYSISFFLTGIVIDNLVGLYISRGLNGLFAGALYTAATASIVDMTTETERNRYIGMLGACIGMGFIIGPAIGGMLSHFGNAVPFQIASNLLIILFLYTFFTFKESLNNTEEKDAENSFKKFVRLPAASIGLLFITFTISMALAGLESTYQLLGKKAFDITPFQVGIIFLASGLVDAFIQGGLIRYIRNGDEKRYIIIGQVISATGLFLIPFITNLLWAGICLSIFTAGNALVRTCTLSFLTKQVKTDHGTISGLNFSFDSLGRIIGPIFFTMIFTSQGAVSFIVGGIITMLSTGLVIIFSKKQHTYGSEL